MVVLLYKALPRGVGQGDFSEHCRRTRRLANATITSARVETWHDAAQMGTAFPQLEELWLLRWDPRVMEGGGGRPSFSTAPPI